MDHRTVGNTIDIHDSKSALEEESKDHLSIYYSKCPQIQL